MRMRKPCGAHASSCVTAAPTTASMFPASLNVGSTSHAVPDMAAYPSGVRSTSNGAIADALDGAATSTSSTER